MSKRVYPRRGWTDIESTGVSPKKDFIVELAVILELGKDIHLFHKYSYPEKFPDDYIKKGGAYEKNGLSEEFLRKHGVDQKSLYHLFTDWLDSLVDKHNKKDKLVFCGKNVKMFDMPILNKLFKDHDNDYFFSYFYPVTFDLDNLIAMYISEVDVESLLKYKLKNVCEFLGVKLEKAHSATGDIKATGLACRAIMKKILDENIMQRIISPNGR